VARAGLYANHLQHPILDRQPNQRLVITIFIDRIAGKIIRLVASVCVRVCPFTVGALLFEPFYL